MLFRSDENKNKSFVKTKRQKTTLKQKAEQKTNKHRQKSNNNNNSDILPTPFDKIYNCSREG